MDYRTITTDRQFKDATSFDRASFDKLLSDFTSTYIDIKGQSYESYIKKSVMEYPKLETLGDALFFVLFQMKNDLVFGSLGVVFNMSVSGASNNFKYFSEILEVTLKKRQCPNVSLRMLKSLRPI